MQFLAYEDRVLDELALGTVMIVRQSVGTAFEQEAEKLAAILEELGVKLHEQLKQISAYKHGYLFYRFKTWLNNDVVLARFEKLDVDVFNNYHAYTI
jgi:hypothetical protein